MEEIDLVADALKRTPWHRVYNIACDAMEETGDDVDFNAHGWTFEEYMEEWDYRLVYGIHHDTYDSSSRRLDWNYAEYESLDQAQRIAYINARRPEPI